MQGLNLQVFFQDLQDLHISKEATVIIRSHCDNLASSNSLSAWLQVEGFLKTTDQPTTYQPTKQPPTTAQPIIDQMHRPPTKRSPTSKKFEEQQKFEFIFDITYDFKDIVLKTCFLKSCSAILICAFFFLFFFAFKEGVNENIVLKK